MQYGDQEFEKASKLKFIFRNTKKFLVQNFIKKTHQFYEFLKILGHHVASAILNFEFLHQIRI